MPVSFLAVALASWLATQVPAAQAPEFKAIFNGQNLGGWDVPCADRVSVSDGMLEVNGDSGWLLATGQHFDFTLRFEAKIEPGSEASVLIRALTSGKAKAAYEVLLGDGKGRAGQLRRLHPAEVVTLIADQSTSATTGDWQTFVIACEGNIVRVTIDGVSVVVGRGMVQNVGRIGFHVAKGRIAVRRIQLQTTPDRAGHLAPPPGVVMAADEGVDLPRVKKSPRPGYTQRAMDQRAQGTVWLSCVVRRDGRVDQILVQRSLTPDLDQEAIKAARRWRFEPARRHGQPVDVLVVIELTFTLR